jgi:hypothetical protein
MTDGNALQNTYLFSASSGGTNWSFHSTLQIDNNYYTTLSSTKRLIVVQGIIQYKYQYVITLNS